MIQSENNASSFRRFRFFISFNIAVHRAPYCESAPQPPLMKRTNDTARAPPPDRKMISDDTRIVNQKENDGVGADIIRPRRTRFAACRSSANPQLVTLCRRAGCEAPAAYQKQIPTGGVCAVRPVALSSIAADVCIDHKNSSIWK